MSLTRSAVNPRITQRIGVGLVTALVVGVILAPPQQAAAAPIPAPDGLSELTAAASCWEIKQNDAASPSGVYWLLTPAMGAAERFYCDQETNGGGWVLIGRGREDWSNSNEGRGTPAQVSAVTTGQAAFQPRQLSSNMIEALLNGGSVGDLADGIRLRRALTQDGSSWQEVGFTFASPRVDWTWQFNNLQRVANWTIGDLTGTGGTTTSFGSGTLLTRVETINGAQQGWVAGFGYGRDSRGSASDTSYIWAPTATARNPRPFTQVFLRPTLISSTIFTAIADGGTPKVEQRVLADSFAEPTTWGVTGIGAGSQSIEGSNEVSAFAEAHGVMYVGGNFTSAQRTSTGTGSVAQPYLAAFSVATGELITSFRPVLNNQVKALTVLPNGNIAAGGYFTEVNGEARTSLVALHPTTGATIAGFSTQMVNRVSGGAVTVRGLDVQGSWLYIGGTFTHFTWNGDTRERYMRNGARVNAITGQPDTAFNPEFNGTVVAVDASAQGDQTYFGGFFNTSKQTTRTNKGAAIRTSDGTALPWNMLLATEVGGRGYQQAVLEVGSKVWIGGSQHQLYSYDRNTFANLSTNIGNPNGDFQAISADGQTIYGGCHCNNTQYENATQWTNINNVGTTWTSATKIESVGAWDHATGLTLPDFSPILSSRAGAGSWAQITDSTGKLWTGGAFTASVRTGFLKQWSGGFVRFDRRDSSAPTSPSRLTASSSPSGVVLNWASSTDDSGIVEYQVLRNDRVVATTTARTITLPEATPETKYFIRAADAGGNLSASTTSVSITAPVDPPPPAGELVAAGSHWRYREAVTAPPADWNTVAFDSSTWSTGKAPIGFGHANLGTTLTAPSPRPVATYYSRSVAVTDASKLGTVTLTTRADDGIAVYVNGVEVARRNISAGAISFSTYANAAVTASSAVSNPVTITIPGSAFRNGNNVIAAEVHLNYRTTPSASFELTAKASMDGTAPADPPADPPAGLPSGTLLVANDSTWSYLIQADAPAAEWASSGFNSTVWPTGASVLGWGTTGLGTEITTTVTPKPLAVYFRHSFTIPTGQLPAGGVRLTTRADDGIVIYVNGVEVGRSNISDGPIGHNTYAISARSTATATAPANAVTIDVPASALAEGLNVISAQVVSNYRATPNKTFALTAVVT
ncbi:MAG: hypothetical protein JWP30_1065 [Homoserinimonas sp.]|nr:hypothetical protein [Homoserinimonas sp.]